MMGSIWERPPHHNRLWFLWCNSGGFLLNYTTLAHIVAATLQRQLVNDSEYGPAARASPNCSVYKMVAKHCAEKPKHNRRDGADAPPKVGCGEPHAQLPSDLFSHGCSTIWA